MTQIITSIAAGIAGAILAAWRLRAGRTLLATLLAAFRGPVVTGGGPNDPKPPV